MVSKLSTTAAAITTTFGCNIWQLEWIPTINTIYLVSELTGKGHLRNVVQTYGANY